jgi:hypothetical protein
MLCCDALSAGLEEIKHLATTGNSLTVEQFLNQPQKQGGIALLVIGEDGQDVEEVPYSGKIWRIDRGGGLAMSVSLGTT